jgi:transcriptional regulator with XRE-family HTH domain
MQLNDNIRDCRKVKGLSQENMADLLRMTQPNYSKLEHKAFIDEPTLLRIAKALNTTPHDLHHFHLPPKSISPPADLREQLLDQKDETIRALREQVLAQKETITELRERLVGYLQGGGGK